MSRQDNYIGLNTWAKKFIDGEKVFAYTEMTIRTYPNGSKEIPSKRDVYIAEVKKETSGETYLGMFDTKYPLFKYIFSDGKTYYEKVQTSPWSSGPNFFMALKDENGKWIRKSRWTQKQIEAYL